MNSVYTVVMMRNWSRVSLQLSVTIQNGANQSAIPTAAQSNFN
jgi:hypothetical protein